MSQINDKHICDLLTSGNRRGMELLFEKYYEGLVLWADTFLNDMDKARDLVQDYFIKIWEKKVYKNLDPNRLESYLYVSIKNLSYNSLRKKDLLKNTFDVESFDRVYEEYQSNKEELFSMVLAEIENLPKRSREVLKCIYLKGMKYREAAEELQVSTSTIKTLLARSLKTIRIKSKKMEDLILLCFFTKK